MQAFVVHGKNAKISAFPHSAFLSISCKLKKDTDAEVCICGSSIINQHMILTAGHCLSGCAGSLSLTASVGSEDIYSGISHSVQSYVVHEKYNDVKVTHDIALGKLKTPLKFNSHVKRVVLMKHPPYHDEAIAAGWGLIDELKGKMTRKLKFTKQYVARKSDCVRVFRKIPEETLCASNKDKSSYMSQ
ncbi:unnamed protein product [Arctia plantaginis]|uniref:Peptidase S1 domain-containing protein n=1 Tax=Arctia plantaginis TaxID=874455 RepID=A0A8S0ZBF2_ARCPL|nr:unnamed protein product [Arctia plantaginis]